MAENSLSPSRFASLDDCLDQFEAAWKVRPKIADFLASAGGDGQSQSRLARELLLLDLHYRRQRGETPSPEDYFPQLPNYEGIVREVVAPVAETQSKAIDGSTTLPQGVGATDAREIPHWSAGRFRVISEHAKGGLGVVFRAEDMELRREVALKEIQSDYADDGGSRGRFAKEAELTGQLEHPGIVPVYSLAAHENGRPFYAMRFIRGESLKDAIQAYHAKRNENSAAAALGLRQLLGRFVQVCNAIAYAHSRQVIHRDIKPANIMLGEFGETLVVDWGLAKRLGQPDGAPTDGGADDGAKGASAVGDDTRPGSVLGTPAYMSPEQARGEIERVNVASDVFGLGATLFHLLTGQPAVTAQDIEALKNRVASGDFDRPRQVSPWIPRSLEAICLKAMAPQPESRYATAKELAEDVEGFLADERVTAYRESTRERAGRWLRKHPTIASTAAAALVLVAVGAALAAVQQNSHVRELAKQTEKAQTAERRAESEAEGALASAAKAEREARTSREVLLLVSNLFRSSDPLAFEGLGMRQEGETPTELSARRLLERAADQVEVATLDPLTRAYLYDLIGSPLLGVGNYDRAEHLLERAYRLRVESLPAQDPLVADSALHFGRLLHELAFPARAEALYREARTIRERAMSKSPNDAQARLELAEVDFHLARLIAENGGLAEAESMIRSVLATRREILESENRGAQFAQAALMILLAVQGKFAELAAFDPAISLKITPTVASFLAAQKARRERDFDVSRREYQKAIEGASGVLSSEHPFVAMLEADFAGMLREVGDLPEAERYARRAFWTGRRIAPTHPKLLEVATPLAELAESRLDHAAAAEYLMTANRIARARFPEDSSRRTNLGLRLARALAGSKRSSEAALVYLDTLLLQRVRESNAVAGELLGEMLPLLEEGRIDEAWLERARREIAQGLTPPEATETPVAELRLALATALERSDSQGAATLREQARMAIELAYGKSHPFARRCRQGARP